MASKTLEMASKKKDLKPAPHYSQLILLFTFALALLVGIYFFSQGLAVTSYPTAPDAVVLESIDTGQPDFGMDSELGFTQIRRIYGNGVLVCAAPDLTSAGRQYAIGTKVLSASQISSTLDQVRSAGFYSLATEYPVGVMGRPVAYADYILANPSSGAKRTVVYPSDQAKPSAYIKVENILGSLCSGAPVYTPSSLSILISNTLRNDITVPTPPQITWTSSVLPLSTLLGAVTEADPVVTYNDPVLVSEVLKNFGQNTRIRVVSGSATKYLMLDKHLPTAVHPSMSDGALIDALSVQTDPNAAYAATKYPVKFTWTRGNNQSLHSTYTDNNDYIARVIRNRYEDWTTKYFRFVDSDNPTTSFKSSKTTSELRACSNCGSDAYKYADKIINRLINELNFETQSIKNLQLLAQFPARPSGDSNRCGPGYTYVYPDGRAIGMSFGIQNCIERYPSTNRFATAAHELGHGFRLDHLGASDYVMNYEHCWSTRFTTDCKMRTSQKDYLRTKSLYFND